MSYPFDENPFEKYFIDLRHWRGIELELYRILVRTTVSDPNRRELVEKFNNAKKKSKRVIDSNQLTPREIDVYQGELDLALERFKAEFPQPEKPDLCLHENHSLKLKTHADNTTHIVSQCSSCGCIVKDHRKDSIINWENLPSFKEDLKRDEDIEYQRWWNLRNQIIDRITGEDGKIPNFDWDGFNAEYESKKPKPISPSECKHPETLITYRQYDEKSNCIVIQCLECGKHIKSISKKKVENIYQLPDFDPTIEERRWKACDIWYKGYSQALDKAKKSYKEKIYQEIVSGELKIVDKTTFGSYYESSEWQKTRSRILVRDGRKCQACNEKAECVHHLIYDRIGKENDLDLISLCNSCHNEVHTYQNSMGPSYRLTPNEIKSLVFKRIQRT